MTDSDYSILPSISELDEPVIFADSAPSIPTDGECQVCGKALEYSGRGRRPRFCDDHKTSSKSGSKKPAANATNVKLAEQAADVLAQYNDIACAGLMVGGMPITASRLAEKNPVFRSQAIAALTTDPALCRSILSAGQKSARMSLAFAYILLAAAVTPSAISEVKAKRYAAADE